VNFQANLPECLLFSAPRTLWQNLPKSSPRSRDGAASLWQIFHKLSCQKWQSHLLHPPSSISPEHWGDFAQK